MKRKYEEMQTKSCGVRWFSDGSIDVKKNIHVSVGSLFSLSNEMTFIIVFNMLILRDKFQLFQLLSLQLTTIILAYRESIKDLTRIVEDDEEYFKPEEFLSCKIFRCLRFRLKQNLFDRFSYSRRLQKHFEHR